MKNLMRIIEENREKIFWGAGLILIGGVAAALLSNNESNSDGSEGEREEYLEGNHMYVPIWEYQVERNYMNSIIGEDNLGYKREDGITEVSASKLRRSIRRREKHDDY